MFQCVWVARAIEITYISEGLLDDVHGGLSSRLHDSTGYPGPMVLISLVNNCVTAPNGNLTGMNPMTMPTVSTTRTGGLAD